MSHRSSHRLIAWGKEALRTHKTIDGATDAVVLQLEDDFELREEFLLGCCTHLYPPKDLVWELVYGLLEYILDAQAHGVGIEPNADREAG